MAENKILVGKASELEEVQPKLITNGDVEIGVYKVNGKLYAYQNLCAHAGGPVCEGLVMPQVEEVIAPDKTYQGMKFNYDELHIICPWHGWEYDLKTGEMVGDRKFCLKSFEVVQEGEEIYVLT